MREWLGYFRLEWRLLLGGKMLWVLLASGVFHYVLVQIASELEQSPYYLDAYIAFQAQLLHGTYILPFTMAVLLIGIHVMRRESLVGIADIERSLPISPCKSFVARIAANILPFILLNLVHGVFWFITSDDLDFSFAEKLKFFLFLASFSLAFLFLFVTGLLLGVITRKRIVYIVGLMIWIILIPGSAMLLGHVPLPIARLITFMPNILFNDYYHLFWGSMEPALLWLHWGVYAGVTLLLALFAVYIWYRRQNQLLPIKSAAAIFAISLLLSFSSAYASTHILQKRIDLYHHQLVMIEQDLEQPSIEAPFHILSYDMDVALGKDEQLKVDLQMQILPSKSLESLPFTLRHEYKLSEVTVDGKPARFSQRVNRLTVELDQSLSPVEPVTIVMTYSGQAQDWQLAEKGHAASLQPLHLATAKRIYLPAHLGWYPLAGHIALQSFKEEITGPYAYIMNEYTPSKPSEFTVRLDYPSGIPVFSNLETVHQEFSSGRQIVHLHSVQTAGAMLIGGPFQLVRNGVHTMVATRYIKQESLYEILDLTVQHEQNLLKILEITDKIPSEQFHVLYRGFLHTRKFNGVITGSFGGVSIEEWIIEFDSFVRFTESVIGKHELLPSQTDAYSRQLFTLLITDRLWNVKNFNLSRVYRFVYGIDAADTERIEHVRELWSDEQWLDAIRLMYRNILANPLEKQSMIAL